MPTPMMSGNNPDGAPFSSMTITADWEFANLSNESGSPPSGWGMAHYDQQGGNSVSSAANVSIVNGTGLKLAQPSSGSGAVITTDGADSASPATNVALPFYREIYFNTPTASSHNVNHFGSWFLSGYTGTIFEIDMMEVLDAFGSGSCTFTLHAGPSSSYQASTTFNYGVLSGWNKVGVYTSTAGCTFYLNGAQVGSLVPWPTYTPSVGQTFFLLHQADDTPSYGGASDPGTSYLVGYDRVFVAGSGGDSAPSFTADSPPAGTVGTAYGPYTFEASGTPAPTFSVSSGALPTGLTLNSSTGVLSGTPTATGTYNFIVEASNSVGNAFTSDLSITISSGEAGGGSIAVVQQGNYGGGNSGDTVTLVNGEGDAISNIGSGHACLLNFIVYDNESDTDSISELSTNFGEFTKANNATTGFIGDQEQWYCPSCTGGGNEITVTTAHGSDWSVQLIEASGAGSVAVIGNAAPDSATPGLSITPTEAGSLVVVMINSDGAMAGAPASPWVDYNTGTWAYTAGADVAYQIVSSTAEVTAAWAQTSQQTGLLGIVINPVAIALSTSAALTSSFSAAITGAVEGPVTESLVANFTAAIAASHPLPTEGLVARFTAAVSSFNVQSTTASAVATFAASLTVVPPPVSVPGIAVISIQPNTAWIAIT